jgi:hypothetical protein
MALSAVRWVHSNLELERLNNLLPATPNRPSQQHPQHLGILAESALLETLSTKLFQSPLCWVILKTGLRASKTRFYQAPGSMTVSEPLYLKPYSTHSTLLRITQLPSNQRMLTIRLFI